MPTLCEGGFIERGENILAFGLLGRGKSHVCCAIGHELIQRGYRVLFVPAFRLVQGLLIAKRDLELDRELRRLDGFDVVLIDDIGYVQQDREEMEVLFTFLAERYERKSVMISSNLVFSKWDQIFKDPMTTAAAIDRLVHHAVILELTGSSYRANDARKRAAADPNAEASEAGKEKFDPHTGRSHGRLVPGGLVPIPSRVYGWKYSVGSRATPMRLQRIFLRRSSPATQAGSVRVSCARSSAVFKHGGAAWRE